MIKKFQLTLPGTRPRLDGAEVAAPAQFYQRTVTGGEVCGLWIGGQRIYDVTIFDAADRHVGSIGPDSPHVSASYDALQRVLIGEGMQARPVPAAVDPY